MSHSHRPQVFDATLLNRCVEGCAESHQVLLTAVTEFTDKDCQVLSRLPGWTRGHVLTHLARNAQSHIGLFESAGRGEIGDQYPTGMKQRNIDIEIGAQRSAEDVIADLRRHTWNLEGMWARATPETWQGSARRPTGQLVPMSELVFLRWREVAVHLIDLNIGVDYHSWSDLYIEIELSRHLTALDDQGFVMPPQVEALSHAQQLSWIIGRSSIEGVSDGPGFQV